jgi:hypothetical protein
MRASNFLLTLAILDCACTSPVVTRPPEERRRLAEDPYALPTIVPPSNQQQCRLMLDEAMMIFGRPTRGKLNEFELVLRREYAAMVESSEESGMPLGSQTQEEFLGRYLCDPIAEWAGLGASNLVAVLDEAKKNSSLCPLTAVDRADLEYLGRVLDETLAADWRCRANRPCLQIRLAEARLRVCETLGQPCPTAKIQSPDPSCPAPASP